MPENRKRAKQIIIRVDEEEYKIIKHKAELAGKNMTQYIRYMSIVGRIIKADLEDIKILSTNLGRFSSSANQIAKRANATGNVYEEDIMEIKSMEEEIWQELKSIRLILRSMLQ